MKDLMTPERAVGMNHYICYLKEMKEYDELSELLISLNRPEEAAYLEYQRKLEQNKSAKEWLKLVFVQISVIFVWFLESVF